MPFSGAPSAGPGPIPANMMWAAVPMDTPEGAPETESTIDWRRYIEGIRRRLLLTLAIVVSVVGVTTIWTVRQQKLYTSTATVLITTSTPKVLTDVEDVMSVGSGTFAAFYETEYSIIKSRAVAARAADKLALRNDDAHNGLAGVEVPEEREKLRATLDVAGIVMSKYTVEPEPRSMLVRIVAIEKDAAAAAAVANAVAEAYAEQNLERRSGGNKDAGIWLAVQQQELKKKLEASEDVLYKFMADNDILNVSFDSQIGEIKQRLDAFNTNLATVQADRVRRSLDAQALREAHENPVLIYSMREIQGATVVSSLKTKLIDLKARRSELLDRYQDAHPRVQEVDAQIIELNAQLKNEIEGIVLGMERDQASLETTESGLKRMITEVRDREARLNHLSLEYFRLKRDVETNTKLYDMVTNRMKEADITSALPFNNVRVVDRALVPKSHFRPSVPLNALIALLLGLFFGLLVALVLELLDTTIKSQEDVKAILKIPFLGMLPAIETDRLVVHNTDKAAAAAATHERDLYLLEHPKSPVAEYARFIRTNLLFMSLDKPVQAFAVTSPGPEEGKTTTAVSLAATMAQAGRKTLIVDTDMRRPRLHKVFGIPNDVGMSSLILGDVKLEDAVQASGYENLLVLPCGHIPPNPSELLHSDRFKEVLADLCARFDYVIFDAPPIGAVADPAVLAAQLGGIVLVVKSEKTGKESARSALRALKDAKAHVLGVVLNDIDPKGKRYGGYGYSYHSHYGAYGTPEGEEA